MSQMVKANPDKPEGFALMDTIISEAGNQLRKVYSEVLWNMLLGMDLDSDQYFSLPYGVNPEALAPIAGHLSYGDKSFTQRLMKLLTSAYKMADIDSLRPLLLLSEHVMHIVDQFAWYRLNSLWGILKEGFEDATVASPELAMEYANFIVRTCILYPELVVRHGLPAMEWLQRIEVWLRSIESDPKQGYGKSPAWLAELVDKEGRPECQAASPVAMSDRDLEVFPLKRAMTLHLVNPGSLTWLSLRDEMHIVGYVPVGMSMRATVILQRMRRLLQVHGRDLLPPAEIARALAKQATTAPPQLTDVAL